MVNRIREEEREKSVQRQSERQLFFARFLQEHVDQFKKKAPIEEGVLEQLAALTPIDVREVCSRLIPISIVMVSLWYFWGIVSPLALWTRVVAFGVVVKVCTTMCAYSISLSVCVCVSVFTCVCVLFGAGILRSPMHAMM